MISLAKHRTSSRSSSATRTLNRKNSLEKSNIISNFHENFIDKLNKSLANKQQNVELVKAANILQRKQSVPDLNELNSNLKCQNRVAFSSSLNLTAPNQSFQLVEIQTNSTQQPIYASRTQLNHEIQQLYGSRKYETNPDSSLSYQNGFFNKVSYEK